MSAISPAGEAPWFFIQLSDPQFGMFAHNADFVKETANCEAAVDAVNRLHPDFVIVTGDLVNRPGDPAQIAEYKRLMALIAPGIAVHHVAGNHDVGSTPTPETIAAYEREFGPDHYTFQHKNLFAIVLDSNLIADSSKSEALYQEQDRWLKETLQQAQAARGQTVAIFQHHPWFLRAPQEPAQYFNLPLARRAPYLALFHQFAVPYLFSGHYHRNALCRDGDIQLITSGPVGKPMGDGKSGLRIAIVRGQQIEHAYYPLAEVPEHVDLSAK